jgi:hypothetical protein
MQDRRQSGGGRARTAFGMRFEAWIMLLAVLLLAGGCGGGEERPSAKAQSEVAVGDQQALWSAVAETDLSRFAERNGQVETRRPLELAQVTAKPGAETPAPGAPTLVALDALPARAEPMAAPAEARVVAVEAERIALDGPQGRVELRARAAGRTLDVAKGEVVQLRVSAGTVFQRRDYLELRGERDSLGYALVGGQSPVRIALPVFGVVARQEGDRRKDNTMGVVVEVGDERRRVEALDGKPLRFADAGLEVVVLASVAAGPDAAGVLPESHRLEIAVWPLREKERAGEP